MNSLEMHPLQNT